MYKNYIFDLYGTLIDIRTDEWSEEPWEEFAAWLTGNGMPYTGSEVKALYDNEVNRLTSVKLFKTSDISAGNFTASEFKDLRCTIMERFFKIY